MNKIYKIFEYRKKGYSWFEIFKKCIRIISERSFEVFNQITTYFTSSNFIRLEFKRVKYNYQKLEKQRIVILETGVLGDVLLVGDVFKTVTEFCKKKQIELIFVCSFLTKKILTDFYGLEGIDFACYENRNKYKYLELRRILKNVNRKLNSHLLMRDSNPYAIFLSQYINAKEKYFFSYDLHSRCPDEKKIINKVFTESRNFSQSSFIPDIWKELVKKIGLLDYETKIGRIELSNDICKEYKTPDKYFLIMCESSDLKRCLELSKFKSVINHIKLNYSDYEIIVCMTGKLKKYCSSVKTICELEKVKCLIGSTTFEEFVKLVKKTSLLISCDSGQVHLAAALGVPSVTFSAYWNGPHFFPYKFDVVRDDECIPENVYPRFRRECQYCGEGTTLGYFKECRKQTDQGKCFLCLSDVEIEDVLNVVDKKMCKEI